MSWLREKLGAPVDATLARATSLGRSLGRNFGPSRRRIRRVGVIVLVLLLVYGLAGFIAVPLILERVVPPRVAAAIHRPVSIERARFNPFRLILDLDALHVGDVGTGPPLADIGHLHVKVSWTSLFRLGAVVRELSVERPMINLVRLAPQQFNFSDLLESPKPVAPPPPPSKPLHFAFSNIRVSDGRIRLDDRVLGQQHTVDRIQLGVPFIANLPADTDIFVQPLLKMVVDGSPLRIAGQSKPFGPNLESNVELRMHRLDLSRYIDYVPEKLPIKIPAGALSALLELHFFEESAHPQITVTGAAAIDQLDVRDNANSPLLSIDHFVVDLAKVEPLARVIHLSRIRIRGVAAHLVRNPGGIINVTSLTTGNSAALPAANNQAVQMPAANRPAPSALAAPVTTPATPAPIAANASPAPIATNASPAPTPAATSTPIATNAAPAATPLQAVGGPLLTAPATPAPSAAASASGSSSPLDFSLDALDLNGAMDFIDKSGPAPATLALDALHMGLKDFHTLGSAPATYLLTANVHSGGKLAVKGALDLSKSQVTTQLALEQLDLPAFQNFAAPVLAATIAGGKLTIESAVRTDFASNHFNLHVEPATVAIDNFALRSADGRTTPAQWHHIDAAIQQVDLASHQAVVSAVHTDGINLMVQRAKDGQLNLAALGRSATPPASGAPAAGAVSKPRHQRHHRSAPTHRRTREAKPAPTNHAVANAGPQWQYRVESVTLAKTEIHVEDESTPQRVQFAVTPLNLQLQNISSDFARPITLALDGALDRGGSFKLAGTAVIAPLSSKLRVSTHRLNLAVANPYLSSGLNTTVTSAALTSNGALDFALVREQPRVRYRGDVTLGSVRVLDKLTSDNFARWGAFSLKRIDVGYGNGRPRAHIGEVALSNFYARIILNRDGRLNLSDVTTNPQTAPTSVTRSHEESANLSPSPTSSPSPTPAAATPTPSTAASPAATTPAAAAPPAKPLEADVEIGGIALSGGHVNYSDNFIRPNYSADLTEIGGHVSAFGTASNTPATVLLEGEVNGNAPINISGSINPLVPMAFVDIKAKANGIELTGLSPYSTKYTGYPIVKGALTVDVHYLLDHNNLTANNHIFIDQLTFGEHVQNTTAINLPFRLAVALLKNSRGEIDLQVPVSGSLNDPHFSIGSVILHVFANLIVKAATSPFSLIASTFGGGHQQQLDYIAFAPGLATLTPDAQSQIATITRALTDRPGLRLEITGRVDPARDVEGLRQAMLAQAVRAEKIKDEGNSADAAAVAVPPDEYDKYLKRAYKKAKFDKPKDLVGLTKSIPPDEMKSLMLANTKVTNDDLRHLADARAAAVRTALSKKIDPSRISVAAPKLDASGVAQKDKTTRADLALK
jgi:uncharacterized protein involved in outer membrane biogenesis